MFQVISSHFSKSFSLLNQKKREINHVYFVKLRNKKILFYFAFSTYENTNDILFSNFRSRYQKCQQGALFSHFRNMSRKKILPVSEQVLVFFCFFVLNIKSRKFHFLVLLKISISKRTFEYSFSFKM